ncbi:unnamed protein product [Adineta steineri]|uniref:NHL repeat containing protein n=1 Tax=Adineta steineri TaxID=433720 RepID=A0A815KIW6_9BILA|nr:unnamed protein product [Adineta steineri]CAF1611971.1 unnamed protein product [Adineta steineri]
MHRKMIIYIIVFIIIIFVSISVIVPLVITQKLKRDESERQSQNMHTDLTTSMSMPSTQIIISIPTVGPWENRRNFSTENCSLPLIPVYYEAGDVKPDDQYINQLYRILDLFLDQNDNLYAVDAYNNRILKYKSYSREESIAAGNGVDTRPELRYPTAIFVDQNENMYIVDHNVNNSYRVIFWPNNSREGIVIINNTNSLCFGISLDWNLNIFTSEYNNGRVVKWLTPFYENYSVVAGNGTIGNQANQLNSPRAIYLHYINDDLYIMDEGNNRTQRWSSGAKAGITVAEDVTNSVDIAVDCHNNLYIVDGLHSIIKYYGSTAITGLEGITIISTHNTDSIYGLNRLKAIAFDSTNGNIYIANSYNSIKSYFIDSELSVQANGTQNITLSVPACLISKNSRWTQTPNILIGNNSICGSDDDQLCHPSDLFLDIHNNIYIADTNNDRIQRYDFLNKTISTVPYYGLTSPSSVLVNSYTNDLYILDYDQSNYFQQYYRIKYWQSELLFGKIIINNNEKKSFTSDVAYAFLDKYLNIYISEYNNGYIRKWLSPHYIYSTIVAKNTTTNAEKNNNMAPRGLFLDENDILYFYDDNNSQIQKWSIGSTNGLTLISNLPSTERITSDCYGNIYFGSNSNHNIYQYDILSRQLKIIIMAKNTSYIGAIKLDTLGNLYVIDTYNNQLLKYSIL